MFIPALRAPRYCRHHVILIRDTSWEEMMSLQILRYWAWEIIASLTDFKVGHYNGIHRLRLS